MSTSENNKSRTASDIIKKWVLHSPSHGIRRIYRSETLISRLFWTYIFWIFTIVMTAFIHIAIVHFNAHPTKFHLSIKQHQESKHFPAVTFCNINPLRSDGFPVDDKKLRFRTSNLSSFLNESEYRKGLSAYINRILAAQVNGQIHPFVKWGFKLDDLLIHCKFNERNFHRNLTQLFHPNYGNCYTFDNDIHAKFEQTNGIDRDRSIDDNNKYKLFLELYLHQSVYSGYLDERAAFRIFIHRKYEVPMLSQNSLFIGPNKYTKFSFSQRIMSFSQECRNDLTDYMKQIFFKHKVRYTQALCYKLCEQRFIQEKCNCIEPTLAVFYQFFNNNNNDINNNNETRTNISLCSIDNTCLSERSYFKSQNSCQECLPECEVIQYSVQSSYAYYPDKKEQKKVLQRVKDRFRYNRKAETASNTSDGSPSNLAIVLNGNIVAVEISASAHAIEVLTESPIYTWGDLISSIGGQTGLWIGVSLIGFVEIIELSYLLISRFYSYLFSV